MKAALQFLVENDMFSLAGLAGIQLCLIRENREEEIRVAYIRSVAIFFKCCYSHRPEYLPEPVPGLGFTLTKILRAVLVPEGH